MHVQFSDLLLQILYIYLFIFADKCLFIRKETLHKMNAIPKNHRSDYFFPTSETVHSYNFKRLPVPRRGNLPQLYICQKCAGFPREPSGAYRSAMLPDRAPRCPYLAIQWVGILAPPRQTSASE